MRWLLRQCEDGRFGSTQRTILALKAIIAYDQQALSNLAGGQVVLKVNATEVESKSSLSLFTSAFS